MKFFVATLLTALLSFIGGLWFDWWILAVAAFLTAALVHQKPLKAFLSGFLGVFLLWALLSWWIDMQNQGVLSAKIAMLLPLDGSTFLLIVVSAFTGGLVAGSAALSGSYFRKIN